MSVETKPRVVILCGGQGTRLREETEFKPKPLVDVGGMPILWHIMKIYGHSGFDDFILCLGEKGEMIKDFFLRYEWLTNDFTLNLKSGKEYVLHHDHEMEDWRITFADTGDNVPTGDRIKKVEKYLNDAPYFLCTYGDGVTDLDINQVIEFHKQQGRMATLTGVHPSSKYGLVDARDTAVSTFVQKPELKDYINGGFFVFNKEFLGYLREGEMVEQALERLARDGQLSLYKHEGFWHSMDTFKDFQELNTLWSTSAPWKVWSK